MKVGSLNNSYVKTKTIQPEDLLSKVTMPIQLDNHRNEQIITPRKQM